MSGERTEAATPKHRAEARQKGQIARSVDLTATASLLGALAILQASGPSMISGLGQLLREMLGHPITELPASGDLVNLAIGVSLRFFLIMAPLFVGLMVIGVVANISQIGFLISSHGLTPDFSKLNPAQGFARLFGSRGLVELIKSLAKMGVIGGVTYVVFMDRYQAIIVLTGADPLGTAGLISSAVFELAFKAAAGLLVIAILDYGYQRWQLERSLRMTKQEIKQEYKESEGDPQLKGRIRRTQRQMATRRMMQQVPKAAVVLTNPTHYAVALGYDPARYDAPTVVAKGQDLVAQRIKEVAREAGVPVLENKPLTRALFAACAVDEPVPADLYQAVAEVLAFIFSLKHRRRRADIPIQDGHPATH